MNPDRFLSNQEHVREMMRKLRDGNEHGLSSLVMTQEGKLKTVPKSQTRKPGHIPIHQEDLKVSVGYLQGISTPNIN